MLSNSSSLVHILTLNSRMKRSGLRSSPLLAPRPPAASHAHKKSEKEKKPDKAKETYEEAKDTRRSRCW